MKRKDIILFVVIGIISAVLSIVVSNYLFSSPNKNKVEAEIVQPISAEFPDPDPAYFNSSAFDPTKQITIGQTANTEPFKGTGTR